MLPRVLLGENIFGMKIKQLLFLISLLGAASFVSCFAAVRIEDPEHPRARLYQAILKLDLLTVGALLKRDPTLSFEAIGKQYYVGAGQYMNMLQVIDKMRPLTIKQREKLQVTGALRIIWRGDMDGVWLTKVADLGYLARLGAVFAKSAEWRSKKEREMIKEFALKCKDIFKQLTDIISAAQNRCLYKVGQFDPILQMDRREPSSCCIS